MDPFPGPNGVHNDGVWLKLRNHWNAPAKLCIFLHVCNLSENSSLLFWPSPLSFSMLRLVDPNIILKIALHWVGWGGGRQGLEMSKMMLLPQVPQPFPQLLVVSYTAPNTFTTVMIFYHCRAVTSVQECLVSRFPYSSVVSCMNGHTEHSSKMAKKSHLHLLHFTSREKETILFSSFAFVPHVWTRIG